MVGRGPAVTGFEGEQGRVPCPDQDLLLDALLGSVGDVFAQGGDLDGVGDGTPWAGEHQLLPVGAQAEAGVHLALGAFVVQPRGEEHEETPGLQVHRGKVPLARVVRVVGEAPAREREGLARGVPQLHPVGAGAGSVLEAAAVGAHDLVDPQIRAGGRVLDSRHLLGFGRTAVVDGGGRPGWAAGCRQEQGWYEAVQGISRGTGYHRGRRLRGWPPLREPDDDASARRIPTRPTHGPCRTHGTRPSPRGGPQDFYTLECGLLRRGQLGVRELARV